MLVQRNSKYSSSSHIIIQLFGIPKSCMQKCIFHRGKNEEKNTEKATYIRFRKNFHLISFHLSFHLILHTTKNLVRTIQIQYWEKLIMCWCQNLRSERSVFSRSSWVRSTESNVKIKITYCKKRRQMLGMYVVWYKYVLVHTCSILIV